jgi:hypothetical protein
MEASPLVQAEGIFEDIAAFGKIFIIGAKGFEGPFLKGWRGTSVTLLALPGDLRVASEPPAEV